MSCSDHSDQTLIIAPTALATLLLQPRYFRTSIATATTAAAALQALLQVPSNSQTAYSKVVVVDANSLKEGTRRRLGSHFG